MKTFGMKRGFSTGMTQELRDQEILDEIELKRIKGKIKQNRWVSNRFFNKRVLVEHVLSIGDKLMPITKTMTLSEAFRLNKEYEKEFLDGKKPRLYRWGVLDLEKLREAKRALNEYWVDYGHKGFKEAAHKLGYKVTGDSPDVPG